MGTFDKKKKQKEAQEKEQYIKKLEQKQYITGAGVCIVSKSLLYGASKLKWLFREDNKIGNGWVAFGDKDTQVYLDNAENLEIVNFNILANIEPAVLNVFYMPIGTDLEFYSDENDSYFIDTKTRKEIREPVKHPIQMVFEKNLKFLNQESYSSTFFQGLFEKKGYLETFIAGKADFPSGEVVLADPLAYLGIEEYATYLERRIPTGDYPVELSICHSKIVGPRIVAARLKISDKKIDQYEIAMPKGRKRDDFGKPGVFSFFCVDTGLACFSDVIAAKEYSDFITAWRKANPGKKEYVNYFAPLFEESYKMYPEVQIRKGDVLLWQIPQTNHSLVMFSSGMGDGIYSGYWGIDVNGEAAELIIPFINPAYIWEEKE